MKIYRNVTLHIVLNICEFWSRILREGPSPTVLERNVLRKISGPMKEEVTGDWRKLHKEELYDLCCSPNT
jgi:hypothetical protein